MKISLNWLNDWVDIADIAVDDLAHRLTMAGLEVEGIEYFGYGHDDIVIGQIKSINDHPKADRLVLCEVDAGQDALLQIVCGAKNMTAGDKVPVALAGSQPPALDFQIVERKVMGVMSQGMLCSEEELGLSKESEGLMLLNSNAPIGVPFFDALKLKDVVLSIGLTPNRSDCLSHLGIARDISALYDRPLKEARSAQNFAINILTEAKGVSAERIVIEDVEGCPRYGLAIVEGISVQQSPLWLRQRLLAVGVRAINNVVDATNFVMFDVGQPLHAFDLDKLSGERIIVRRARTAEKLLGIDHREYELDAQDLVIADAQRPVAIAGVMGGAESEVGDSTTRILIECAYFEPRTVRRTAKKLGLHTESSHRFERNVDVENVSVCLQQAVSTVVQLHQPHSDIQLREAELAQAAERVAPQTQIAIEKAYCNRVLGTEIAPDRAEAYLTSIGMHVSATNDHWNVDVPSFRDDLTRPIDLVEELARLHGYDQIPAVLPRMRMGERHTQRAQTNEPKTIVSGDTRRQLGWVRSLLLNLGLDEVVNYSFMSSNVLDELGLQSTDSRRDVAQIANPLIKDDSLMRTTLLPSLITNLRTNHAQRAENVAIFEIGRRYFSTSEALTLGILITGNRVEHWSEKRAWDFFDLKGILEVLSEQFELPELVWTPDSVKEPFLHPGVQAACVVEGEPLAVLGQLHPQLGQQHDFDSPVFVAELDLERLLSYADKFTKFNALSKYPAVTRDYAFLVDTQMPYAKLRGAIDDLAVHHSGFGCILESVELFDLYQGEQVPEGKRSLALQIVYRSSERTLTDDDIEDIDRVLVDWLGEKTHAQLR